MALPLAPPPMSPSAMIADLLPVGVSATVAQPSGIVLIANVPPLAVASQVNVPSHRAAAACAASAWGTKPAANAATAPIFASDLIRIAHSSWYRLFRGPTPPGWFE